MNTTCRFFVVKDGWFITNQNLGTQNPFTVGRSRESDPSLTKTFDEMSRQPGWDVKSHGGDVFSTLVGSLGNLKIVSWVCINDNRFRFEVRNGADYDQILKIAKILLQVTMRECLDLNCQEVNSPNKVFGTED